MKTEEKIRELANRSERTPEERTPEGRANEFIAPGISSTVIGGILPYDPWIAAIGPGTPHR